MTEINTLNEALIVADLTETERRYRFQLAREMYQAGYRQAEDDMAARWARIAAPVVRSNPPHAELELKRWGPGGRQAFGTPRSGDFPGRGSIAA